MGFTEILTIIFVILKLTGCIAWSWWLVLLPEIIAVGLYLIWLAAVLITARKAERKIDNIIRHDWGDWDE